MLKCIVGKRFEGPEYLSVDTGKMSTLYYETTWVPEEEYPFPLVMSRYLLDYKIEGEGSHVVIIKNHVMKVGTWQDCVAWAEDCVKNLSLD